MGTHIRRAYVIYILSRSVDKTVLHRDRPAIIEHVKALARLSSAKRKAVLTLIADVG